MKKIILMLVMLISMVAISAQIATVNILVPNTFGQIVSPTATADIYKITNTTAGYTLTKASMNSGSKQDFVIKLDSVSGNHTNVAVAVYGQKSALKGDWTQIGSTVNWKGTTRDTVIVISNATYVYYQNFKKVYTGTGTGVTKIGYDYTKLWLE
jgi:hypothetical protein